MINQTDKDAMRKALKLAHELKALTGESDPVEIREAVAILSDCRTGQGEDDVELMGYRFIREDAIDDIMQNELSFDTYMLGCFSAWFLADILGISTEAVEKFQASEAYDGLGELIISGGHLKELQEKYASADGYGHHFNSYDGGQDEIFAAPYHAFKAG